MTNLTDLQSFAIGREARSRKRSHLVKASKPYNAAKTIRKMFLRSQHRNDVKLSRTMNKSRCCRGGGCGTVKVVVQLEPRNGKESREHWERIVSGKDGERDTQDTPHCPKGTESPDWSAFSVTCRINTV